MQRVALRPCGAFSGVLTVHCVTDTMSVGCRLAILGVTNTIEHLACHKPISTLSTIRLHCFPLSEVFSGNAGVKIPNNWTKKKLKPC